MLLMILFSILYVERISKTILIDKNIFKNQKNLKKIWMIRDEPFRKNNHQFMLKRPIFRFNFQFIVILRSKLMKSIIHILYKK